MMRWIVRGVIVVAMLAPPAARAKQIFLGGWQGRRFGGYSTQEAPTRERIRAALSLPRADGMDDWKWRDAVEDQLADLGPSAAGYLQMELEARRGYEADAIQVALFRLDHGGVRLRYYLKTWADERFQGSGKIMRVMGSRAILPNHLFYVVEGTEPGSQSRQRVVVALAADGKVQEVGEDARLGRFLQVELAPVRTESARDHAAELAALLAASRYINVYTATVESSAQPLAAHAELTLQRTHIRADVTFDESGRVLTVHSERIGATAVEPVQAPNVKTAPPPMPE